MNRQDPEDARLPEPDFELDETARIVVDAAVEVHRVLGPGLLESIYEQALSVELGLRGVRFERQAPVAVTYKNVALGVARLDFLLTMGRPKQASQRVKSPRDAEDRRRAPNYENQMSAPHPRQHVCASRRSIAVAEAAETDAEPGAPGPWILIGVSSAVVVSGAVLLALALSDKAAIENPSGDMPRYDRSADERVFPMSVAGIAALSLGGAGLIGGIVWKLASDRDETSTSARLQLEPRVGGLRLKAAF